MKLYNYWLFVFAITFCLCTCKQTEPNVPLKAYFFPFDSMITPRVYVYSLGDDAGYCYNRFVSSGNIMAVEIFDTDFKPLNLIIDSLAQEGVFIKEAQGVIDGVPYVGEIENPLIYPFNSSTTVDFNIELGPENSKQKESLKLAFNRISNITFKGKEYKCAIFDEEMNANDSWFNKWRGEIVYAENVGIVKYTLRSANDSITQTLVDIITEEQFDSLQASFQSLSK